MKVIQVNVVYKIGSTGKIVYDLHKELQKKGIQSLICYGRGKRVSEPNVFKTSSEISAKFNALRARITGLQYNGSFIATNKLINILEREKPEIVHIHCINGYFVNIYSLIDYLKKNKIRTVLTLHAEFMYTGSCGHSLDCTKWMNSTGCENCPILWEATKSYLFDRTHTAWEMMRRAFEGFDKLFVVSVSPWVMNRAKQSIILSDKRHITVFNGIDTNDVFHPCEFEYLRKKYGIINEKILLHVTASFISEYKGGKYIIELANRLKEQNIKIIVVGNQTKIPDMPSNIIDVGRVNDQKELAAYYSMADLTILTSKRETFSMICAESLSCGTPIIGFKAGAPEQIAIPEYSEFVEYGDIENLEKKLEIWLNKKVEFKNRIARKAFELYSEIKMCDEYVTIYDRLVGERNEDLL